MKKKHCVSYGTRQNRRITVVLDLTINIPSTFAKQNRVYRPACAHADLPNDGILLFAADFQEVTKGGAPK